MINNTKYETLYEAGINLYDEFEDNWEIQQYILQNQDSENMTEKELDEKIMDFNEGACKARDMIAIVVNKGYCENSSYGEQICYNCAIYNCKDQHGFQDNELTYEKALKWLQDNMDMFKDGLTPEMKRILKLEYQVKELTESLNGISNQYSSLHSTLSRDNNLDVFTRQRLNGRRY